jgi:hypothetical protein
MNFRTEFTLRQAQGERREGGIEVTVRSQSVAFLPFVVSLACPEPVEGSNHELLPPSELLLHSKIGIVYSRCGQLRMPLQSLLIGLLLYVFYPLWLAAGAVDYVCHRRTHISETAGVRESELHVAQFFAVVILFVAAVLFETSKPILVVLVAMAILHTVLAYVDVAYTEKRRYISPLEQHAHGFMDVLPIVAVLLLGVLGWERLAEFGWTVTPRSGLSALEAWLLCGSFIVLAGGPVLEEFVRTARGSAMPSESRPTWASPP